MEIKIQEIGMPPNCDNTKKLQQQQIDQLQGELLFNFNSIIYLIKTDKKIGIYLQQINVTAEDLEKSFTIIISAFQKVRSKINTNHVINRSIVKILNFLLQFLKTKNIDHLDSKGKTVWFLQIQIKLRCCLQFLDLFKEYQDITNCPQSHYPEVWKRITIEKANDPIRIRKQYKALKKILHIATSSSIIQSEFNSTLLKKCSFGLSFTKYFIMNDQAKLKSLIFYRNPTLTLAQKIWNLPELGAARQFSKVTYESIKINKKIYLPFNTQFNKQIDIFTENHSSLTVRILSHQHLTFFRPGENIQGKNIQYIDTVIIHMHGGGFVALSSRSTQNYTRKWAKELNIPVLSIDYRMPPHHPFPQAPLDCFLAYRFVAHHIHNFMNIKPKNIYLAGDSAGGNLACSLTGLSLKYKQPLPKGLYLAYPATDLSIIFTESRLFAFTDPLLWPSMLLLCVNQYLKGDLKQAEDPLASPHLLSEQYVNGDVGNKSFPLEWPRTLMTVGMKDPLLDDTLILMQRMTQAKVDCSCLLYQQLSHGYLSTTIFVKQCQKTIDQSVQHLKQLIEQTRSV